MLRAAFFLTALLLVPLGLLLYFLPPVLAAQLGVSPLWLARAAGALVLAWGAFQVAAGVRPDGLKAGGLLGGNLLTVATLVPAVLRQGESLLPPVRLALLVVSGVLLLAAVLAVLGWPTRRHAL